MMSSLTITRSPNSYQSRLVALNCRKAPSIYLHVRVHKLGRQVQCFSASRYTGNGNVAGQRNLNSPGDTFSGWSYEYNGNQEPSESQLKVGGSEGIVGAGVAGIILVAGLIFGVISISKSASVPKRKMETLTTYQVESFPSDDQNDTLEDDRGKGDDTMLDDKQLEGKTVSPALQTLPGKVLIPTVVDQAQGQALAALQVLKVVEGDVQPGDICTRREYARWLVSSSNVLSRNTASKVYPAMYIENITTLAFDDITPEDPDFSAIQGLAETGLISSKLSSHDLNPSYQNESSFNFCPESPLSRQDLLNWKMSLEKRLLPVADRMILLQCSGFIDIDKINPDAWPALIADLSAGEQGIIALAFGYTRLFQPHKHVTKAQAAIALTTGEVSDVVSEELARIEAESIAEKAVAAHTALVDQVEKDINVSFENDFLVEMEKINAVEKMAEAAKKELERVKAEREKERIKLIAECAAVDSEMEVFMKLRLEVEQRLQSVTSNKVEMSYEKDKLNKLLTDTEIENREIARLQDELEVERKALSMARRWAEEEAKRGREQAKVLEEARDHWKSQGIKVMVDNDLREEANGGVTWLTAANQFSMEGSKSRDDVLIEKLQEMKGKSRETIDGIIQKVLFLISQLKAWIKDWEMRAVQKLRHKFKT